MQHLCQKLLIDTSHYFYGATLNNDTTVTVNIFSSNIPCGSHITNSKRNLIQFVGYLHLVLGLVSCQAHLGNTYASHLPLIILLFEHQFPLTQCHCLLVQNDSWLQMKASMCVLLV